MRNKLSGYSKYAFSADLVMQTSIRRIGKDKYDWISYNCRRGIIMFMNGAPIATSRCEDGFPVGKRVKIHVMRHFGTAEDFDKFVMEMCANTYDDIEPGFAKFFATTLPIIEN